MYNVRVEELSYRGISFGVIVVQNGSSNPQLFDNLFPNEPTPPHSDIILPSKFLKTRGAEWFDYVVLEDGTLVVGTRSAGQGHANLAQGQRVQAAGQVQVSGGTIIEIDNASGHYLPTGPDARQAALESFRQQNFPVADSVYIDKVWNPTTLLWEPLDASYP